MKQAINHKNGLQKFKKHGFDIFFISLLLLTQLEWLYKYHLLENLSLRIVSSIIIGLIISHYIGKAIKNFLMKGDQAKFDQFSFPFYLGILVIFRNKSELFLYAGILMPFACILFIIINKNRITIINIETAKTFLKILLNYLRFRNHELVGIENKDGFAMTIQRGINLEDAEGIQLLLFEIINKFEECNRLSIGSIKLEFDKCIREENRDLLKNLIISIANFRNIKIQQ